MILFLEDDLISTASSRQNNDSWRILIADDELEVHRVTKLALQRFTFLDKPLSFISAYSAAETKEILANQTNIAVILLDVVMEDNESGFGGR